MPPAPAPAPGQPPPDHARGRPAHEGAPGQPPPERAPAPHDAGPAATALDVAIRPLRSAADLRACVELQRATWGAQFSDVVPPALLLDTQRVGGVAAGAYLRTAAGEELVGFVFGLPGLERGEPVHWSDMLAVRADVRDQRLGERLKRWQRERVLAVGCRRMRWTFDPLESRNAWLNFTRLGAVCREYVPDMYGDMASPLHAGIGTDRLVVAWELDGGRVRGRLDGSLRPPGPAEVEAVPLANPVVPGGGAVACEEPNLELQAARVRVAIPADIQRLKREHPQVALRWRAATRAALQGYFGRGYRAAELVRYQGWSAYVLERDEG